MRVQEKTNLLVVSVFLVVCLVIMVFSSSIQGSSYDIEVTPEISLPEYRTDTARAIDAYERVMDRFMSMTESNLTGINTDVKDIAKQLALINYKLSELSARMAKIEKALENQTSEKAN
jgi:hypothetical protein